MYARVYRTYVGGEGVTFAIVYLVKRGGNQLRGGGSDVKR